MPLNHKSKYPSGRAYVLKLRSDALPDKLSGRLENVITGKQCEFSSGHELLDSIASDLHAGTDGTARERSACRNVCNRLTVIRRRAMVH